MTKKREHRPICDVIQEIHNIAYNRLEGTHDAWKIIDLCSEALLYAKSMQARLQAYKTEVVKLAMERPERPQK